MEGRAFLFCSVVFWFAVHDSFGSDVVSWLHSMPSLWPLAALAFLFPYYNFSCLMSQHTLSIIVIHHLHLHSTSSILNGLHFYPLAVDTCCVWSSCMTCCMPEFASFNSSESLYIVASSR